MGVTQHERPVDVTVIHTCRRFGGRCISPSYRDQVFRLCELKTDLKVIIYIYIYVYIITCTICFFRKLL